MKEQSNEGKTIDRRALLAEVTLLAGLMTMPTDATRAEGASGTPAVRQTTLRDVAAGPNVKLTIERRDQIALIGINRPYIQNRIDPEAFQALARTYYDFDHDPSLRAAVLFGHGPHFSRGIDVDGFKAAVATGKPLVEEDGMIDPLAKRGPRLGKPLVVAVHGDTWNMAHELFLVADIRVASYHTNFGQDENTHGRFPGGGSTIRFAREAGWGNAMRYILTGDHGTAAEAYRFGTVQEVAASPEAALQRAIGIAQRIAACGPLGIATTLASAHLAVDPSEAEALSRLDTQYGALYRTRDFLEGREAEAQHRTPVYQGK
jgi:enoyl-CoA hydratase